MKPDKVNLLLIRWGLSNDETIKGISYSTAVLLAKCIEYQCVISGGGRVEPNYFPDRDIKKIDRIIKTLDYKDESILYAKYIYRYGNDSECARKLNVPRETFRDRHKKIISIIANKLKS